MEQTRHDGPVPDGASAHATTPAPGGRPGRGSRRAAVRAIARAAGRSCSRPGCETPAAATLVFSYREQVARVVELLDETEPQAYDLCPAHADRTRPPQGWELSDTRAPRSDAPRRLDDDETVAVLGAVLRGEDPPTRVSVVAGGRVDDEGVEDEDRDGGPAGPASRVWTRTTSLDEEDPLRAALEELQRVATPEDDAAPGTEMAATPLRTFVPGTGGRRTAEEADDRGADEVGDAAHGPDEDDLTLW